MGVARVLDVCLSMTEPFADSHMRPHIKVCYAEGGSTHLHGAIHLRSPIRSATVLLSACM